MRIALLVALLVPALARAGDPAPSAVSPDAYAREVGLIRDLYLHRDDLDAGTLLQSAAEGLSDELDWLMVEADGDAVYLSHGDGTPIGSVSVASLDTLPQALASLEAIVTDAPYPRGDVDVRLEIVKGLPVALDKHSRVLAGEKLDRFDVRLRGTLVGIGATLDGGADEHLVITSIAPGSPAEKGGVLVGDVVVRIDGVSTTNMLVRDATEKFRGEVDTDIALTIERGTGDAKITKQLTLTRAEIVVPNVTWQVLAGDVGYVRIDHFSQKTVDNLVASLDALRAKGALGAGLVIDLRGDTGGSMKEAARSADQFLEQGMLLRTEGPGGERVQNLQARMDAVDAGDEPQVPIVVLVDPQTASGSEILAGALRELDRAVLIGRTTYGKGTVQKIYNLDDDVRLKLTVAEYVLANDRHITQGGLVPDAALGVVARVGDEVRYTGWEDPGLAWDDVIPVVAATDETEPQRSRAEIERQTDAATIELARRTVLAAGDTTSREDTLAALHEVIPAFRAEQDRVLEAELARRGIDWSAADKASDTAAHADVRLSTAADPDDPDRVVLTATVTNQGDAALSRALVEITSDSFDAWNGLVLPIGRIGPGERAQGRVTVDLSPGTDAREDNVHVRLRSDRRPALTLPDDVLRAGSTPIPRVSIDAQLVPDGDHARVQLVLHDLSTTPLRDLVVKFAYPDGLDVELLDGEARIDRLDPRGEATVTLGVRLGPDAPAIIPFDLVIDASGWARIADWTIPVPVDGTPVAIEPPRIQIRGATGSTPVGGLPLTIQVADDRSLDHVVVYANGEKIAWAGGGRSKLDLRAELDVHAGINWLRVVAEDDQGIVQRKLVVVRGEDSTATVDADAPHDGD
jgi:carboxyl-terminal processing protease